MAERWEEIRDDSPTWPGSGYSHPVQIDALCKRIAELERREREWFRPTGAVELLDSAAEVRRRRREAALQLGELRTALRTLDAITDGRMKPDGNESEWICRTVERWVLTRQRIAELQEAQGRQWQHGHDQGRVLALREAADWFENEADNTAAFGPTRVAEQLRRMAEEASN